MTVLDGVVLGLLGLLCVRGLWIGMVREGFSLAALGAAVLAVQYFNAPAAERLVEATGGEVGTGAAPFLTGAALAAAAIIAVGLVGRLVRRGIHGVGLGLADRLGGGVLGIAEGVVAASVVIAGATWLLGPDHQQIEDSRTVAAIADVRRNFEGVGPELPDMPKLPDVAAPPSD